MIANKSEAWTLRAKTRNIKSIIIKSNQDFLLKKLQETKTNYSESQP